ncbi:hypothetical protein JCM8097_008520 [Rhodosporidiobolus ruineniae]
MADSFAACYEFSSPEQFWQELDDLIAVPPDSTLDELDYALRNYIAFAATFMDEYLAAPGALDHALLALLSSLLFTSHADRMTQSIISSISSPLASSSTLFISLMLVLHLGESANPLTTSGVGFDGSSGARRRHGAGAGAGVTVGSSKVFRLLRRRWKEVVPVLMKWTADAAVIEDHNLLGVMPGAKGAAGEEAKKEEKGKGREVGMPAEGWEERVGTAATAVLYEMCRVQKLTPEELADFSYDFISHLFALVERTRDVEDETFNYSLIKLIIALNEQFMVSTVPGSSSSGSNGGGGNLAPPILPTVVNKGQKRERGPNLVLEVLKEKEHECKTFGENIIFILNRADGTPDSLCVSLLILKILYLLFTTSGTQEFFYTNDLCVLVDVFIRELCDLGEESEGLKHTYLRVLHPLLTNTQLRTYPYKRPQLRRVLESLIAPSSYRDVDPTTRRLVERNLRGSWCQGLRAAEDAAAGLGQGAGSTLSVDEVARADDRVRKHRHHHHRKSRRQTSLDDSSSSAYSSSASVSTAPTSNYISSPLATTLTISDGRAAIQPVADRALRDGEVPPAVRASHAAYSYSSSPTELAPSHLPASDDPYPGSSQTSVPSIQAGHSLLDPIAQRHLSPRCVSATHPPTSSSLSSSTVSLAPPIIHPRPRSTSLSAAAFRSSSTSSSSNALGLSDDPPPPLPPSPSPSAGSAPKLRRRPPPPPPADPLSRPHTPASLAPPPLTDAAVPDSPRVGARRRPPPPPVAGAGAGAGGRGSPKSGRSVEVEEGSRRGVEGLAVGY